MIANLQILFCILAYTACTSTVAPKAIHSQTISFDGNQANGGFLGFGPDGTPFITDHARERYNGLVAVYGPQFVPPLKPDAGVLPSGTNGTWRIDAEHLADFARMNRWRKEGR